MSRKEAVLLVSRALAMIQLVSAFIESLYLPDRLLSLHHHASQIGMRGSPASDYYSYATNLDRIGIAFLFARIAAYLLFAFLFWNCGPWIERVLLPTQEVQDQGDPEPGAGAGS